MKKQALNYGNIAATISKTLALLVGLFVEGYCVYYLHPLTVGGIVIVPLPVAMILFPGFFSPNLPDQIGEKAITVLGWAMLILLLAATTARWWV